MKKVVFIILALGLAASSIVFAQETKVFSVYTDKSAQDNHYAPSGWMGDHGDLRIDDKSAVSPHSGATCIEFSYTAKQSQGAGWAGVRWQNPPNNWGSKKGGFDLTGMTKLTFWARGAKGGEKIQKFVVGGIGGTYPDSATVESDSIKLTSEWEEYTINLAGKDLKSIIGGFGWVATAEQNPEGMTFYIDDIEFVSDPSVKEEGKKIEDMPFFVYHDGASIKNHYIPSGWMGDYGDIKLDKASKEVSKEDPQFGETCMKITYTASASQNAGWAGLYWQNPANNWGEVDGGFDLSKPTKVTFWARGEKGGEKIEEFKVGGLMTGNFIDSDTAAIGPVILTSDWQEYTIDLNGKDMSYIIGGFCWSTNTANNPEGAVFYIDEIKYE